MLEEKIDTLVSTLETLIKVLERSPGSAPPEPVAEPVTEAAAKKPAEKKKAAPKKAVEPDAGPNKDELLAAAVDLSRDLSVDDVRDILIEAVGTPKIAEMDSDQIAKALKALKAKREAQDG